MLPGSRDSAISCLCWVGEQRDNLRLFSGGFDGSITEWNLDSLGKKSTQASFGGAIWSIASVKRGKGTDLGELRLVSCENNNARVSFG